MARTGRPPKPIEQKRLTGNPGKRRLPATVTAIRPAIPQVGSRPPEFGGADELVAYLIAEGADRWIGRTDAARFRLLLDDWREMRELQAFVAEHGYSYTSFSKVAGEQHHAWPEVTLLNAARKRVSEHLAALGLDTVSRSRLGVAAVKVEKTKLELLMASRPRATGSATG